MRKIFLAVFGVLTTTIIAMTIIYPEDMALALAFFVIGVFGGGTLATVLMETYFNKGANMTHDLQKKQVANPASIIREARLTEKASRAPQVSQVPVQQQAIPRINITGLK